MVFRSWSYGGDELNILKKGANYGWPLATQGVDYDGSVVAQAENIVGFESPLYQWTPSIAVCPISFVAGSKFKKWENKLLVGALAFEELRLLTLDGKEIVDSEMILKDLGRVRDVKMGPDEAIYVVLNNPDRIIRLN